MPCWSNVFLLHASWQSLMTWRCARCWTVVPSGGLPAAAAPPSLNPPPRALVTETRCHLFSASLRTCVPSCPALREWSVGCRAASAPCPPPATVGRPHPARSTGRSRPHRVGQRTMRAGNHLMEVHWLRPVTLTQTRVSRSWCPEWTLWRTSWGKEARSLWTKMESLPRGRGEWQEAASAAAYSVFITENIKHDYFIQLWHNEILSIEFNHFI